MRYTIAEIAAALGAEPLGASELSVTHAAEPAAADADALALAMSPNYAEGLKEGAARAAVLWEGADWQALGLEAAICVPRPRLAMAGITRVMDKGPELALGHHETALIDPEAEVGEGAAIGPYVVIARGAKIGPRARIASHVSIAEDAEIGADALIYQGVRIGARVQIGDRFIAQPGVAIGGDGFSFVTPEKSAVENVRESLGDAGDAEAQSWIRIHSIGTVHIGNDVEIGANSTVDRGTVRATRIGSGSKLDSLVQVGHNVQVGEDCLLCAQVGLAGTSTIGDRVVLGGQSGVSDNILVGDDVIAGGATKILTNVPKGRVLLGYPAMKMDAHVESYKAIRRLPRTLAKIASDISMLKKAVSKTTRSD